MAPVQGLLTREVSHAGSASNSARRTHATSLRGLATAAALFALLGSAGCVGMTSATPSGPGGKTQGNTVPMSVSPLTIPFGNVVVGTTNSVWVTLSNGGDATGTITKVVPAGSGFIYSGIVTPSTIGAGTTESFPISFDPSSAGASSGSMTIETNTASYTVTLTGTGISSAPQISPSTSLLNFGSVTIGTPSSLPVVLTNTGNADLDISSVTASGAAFAVSGGSGVKLAPSQSVTLSVTFDPSAAGAASGGLAIASNATNSTSVALSGTGVTTPTNSQHSVVLNWDPSASAVIGYFVYRGTISGGPYSKLVLSADTTSSYKDASVSDGKTYYYVVTAVDPSNIESAYSNQVSVTIPSQ